MPVATKPRRSNSPSKPRRATSLWKIQRVVDKTTKSKSAIYAMVQAGLFPRPVQTGKRSVAWVDVEICHSVIRSFLGTYRMRSLISAYISSVCETAHRLHFILANRNFFAEA